MVVLCRKIYKYLYHQNSMTKSINVKISDDLYSELGQHDEINWSGVVRTAIKNKLNNLELGKFDNERARRAFLECKKLRDSEVFKGKKTGAEIVREWRDKRR